MDLVINEFLVKIKTAIFPVGGMGIRFLPVTKSIPKEMLPIFNKPLIQFAVEEALKAGVEKIIFVTGRGKNAIENYFDYSLELECLLQAKYNACDITDSLVCPPGSVAYIRQQYPLGLGHAIWCARHYAEGPFFLVLADDIIFEENASQNLLTLYQKNLNSNILLLKTVKRDLMHRYGIAVKGDKDTVVEVIEKPENTDKLSPLAIIGRYILQPKIFDYLENVKIGINNEIQLTDAINMMIKDGYPCYAANVAGEHFDCGSKEGLLRATVRQAIKEGMKDELIDIMRS